MKNKKIYYLLGFLFILVLIFTILATLRSLKEKQEIRKEAAVPAGVASFSLNPQTATVNVGQSFQVTIKFQSPSTPNNKGITGIRAVLSYSLSGENPLVITADNIQGPLPLPWSYFNKEVNTTGETTTITINALYSAAGESGYTDFTSPKDFAVLNFTTQHQGTVNLSFDPSLSKILAKDPLNEDILNANLPTGTYTIGTVEVSPTPTPTSTLNASLTCDNPHDHYGTSLGYHLDLIVQGVFHLPHRCQANEGLWTTLTDLSTQEMIHVSYYACYEYLGQISEHFHDTITSIRNPQITPRLKLHGDGRNYSLKVYLTQYVESPGIPNLGPENLLKEATLNQTCPGEVQIQLKIKFAGIEKDRPENPPLQLPQQPVRIKVAKGNTVLQDLGEINLVPDGEGIFTHSQSITLSSAITAGENFFFLIKGPKHLQTRYCQASGQRRPCTGANITLNNGANVLDFTTYPLPPGDLPLPQDGVANTVDAIFLTNCFNTLTDQNCLVKADLDLSGNVNSADMNLLNLTIYSRWEDDLI